MKKYLNQNKSFLFFLGTFFLVYGVLTFIYHFYLSRFEIHEIDSITKNIGYQLQKTLLFFGFDAEIIEIAPENFLRLYYKNVFVAKIIEGCNAVSVIILFVSFVVAFSGKFKTTLWFTVLGSTLVYILNIFRIAFLAVLMFYFPEQEHILHGVLFPLALYGVVFVLWFIWVNKYSKYAR